MHSCYNIICILNSQYTFSDFFDSRLQPCYLLYICCQFLWRKIDSDVLSNCLIVNKSGYQRGIGFNPATKFGYQRGKGFNPATKSGYQRGIWFSPATKSVFQRGIGFNPATSFGTFIVVKKSTDPCYRLYIQMYVNVS